MVRRTSLLVPFLVAAICVALRGSEPRGGGEVKTPDEAIASYKGGYVTVEFRAGDVGSITSLQGEGMPPHLMAMQLVADAPLKGGGKFYVYINGKLLEDLNRLCISEEYPEGGAFASHRDARQGASQDCRGGAERLPDGSSGPGEVPHPLATGEVKCVPYGRVRRDFMRLGWSMNGPWRYGWTREHSS